MTPEGSTTLQHQKFKSLKDSMGWWGEDDLRDRVDILSTLSCPILKKKKKVALFCHGGTLLDTEAHIFLDLSGHLHHI